jgi:LPS sulfotransferase NodH
MCIRLLLSTQRCGSHFLKSLIESRFSSVACTGEVLEEPVAFARQFPALALDPEMPHFWLWYEREAAMRSISLAPGRRFEAFALYISKLKALVKPKDLLVDVKYNTLRALSGYWDTEHGSQDFTRFVIGQHIPVLHLIRKNTLRLIISRQLAVTTGVWARTTDRSPDEIHPKIWLNSKTVLAEVEAAAQVTRGYQARFEGHPSYQEIVYEDIVRERECSHTGAYLRTLGHFFSKKASSVNLAPVPWKKISPEDPAEVVENWEEVVCALRGSEHGWMAQTSLLAAA